MSKGRIVSLGDIGTFVRGVTFKPTDVVPPGTEGTAVCMRTKNVQREIDESDLIAIPSSFVRRAEQYLREGDILISSANSWNLVGKCCWVPHLSYLATAGGFICIFRGDEQRVCKRYLFHWLASAPTQSRLRQCGRQTTNISNLSIPLAEKLKVPLPPLPEQKRIAAILDKADEIRRKREKAIELTDSFLKSVFFEMFGDENSVSKFPLKRFADIGVEIIDGDRGKEYPSGDQLQQQGHCLFLSTKNVSKTGFSFEACQFIDEERDSKLRKGKLKRQDVVFTTRGTLGNVAFFDDEVPFNHVRINSGMVIFRCQTSDLSPALLYYLLRSPIIKRQLARHQSGTAQPQIPIRSLSTFQLPVPPRSLQDELAERLIAIDRLRLKHENALSISRALSESISARLFSNEVIHPRSEERQETVHAL